MGLNDRSRQRAPGSHMQILMHRLAIAMLLATMLLAGIAPNAAIANDPASTMIVFDGSGSMWGKIDGEKQAKFVHAREALKTALPKLKPETRVGLVSFGHRRQGDCSDIQVIQSPEANSSEKVIAPLEKLNPKGRGPLTAAMKEAAKALGTTSGPKSLIVIHDDADNCQQDACAALSDLQSAAPGLVIHVIGLGLKSEEANRLSCLVKPTNGKLFDAQSAEQATSGIEEAVRLAALDSAAPKAQVAAPPPAAVSAAPTVLPPPTVETQPTQVAPKTRPSLSTIGPPGIRLAAFMMQGAALPERPIQWTVRQEGSAGTNVFAGTGQDLVVPVPAGKYLVEARDGLVIARQAITVGPRGHTAADLVLNAGLVRIAASTGRDRALAPSNATITLFENASANPSTNQGRALGRPLGVLSARDGETMIPAGSYVARIEQGLSRIDRPLVLAPGGIELLPLQDLIGRLMLTIAGGSNTPAQPVIVTISEDDPDAPRGRREIARSAAPNPDFSLAPGTYYVVAQRGASVARERLAIGAGEVVQRTLTFNSARLTLNSRLKGRGESTDEPISYRIERTDTVPPEVYFGDKSNAVIDLPAGRYVIEARHGLVNARAKREIELRSGEPLNLLMEHDAGTLKLKLTTQLAAVAQEVFWDIRDQSGKPIWAAVHPEPRLTLQSGRYLLRAEIRDKRIERVIDVKSGDQSVVEIKE
jgi:Ca-activated chloride channel homolog